ncbi:hypothetical protein CRG98_028736 [Punica granatum]|uniref:Uncharacterized protein n=1 Tax=Punica granatum TaxID=22663 RepID=A0A2I0J489_PUNGR|nr:hypothetical protein CRG98_028736 [Punica granatum]
MHGRNPNAVNADPEPDVGPEPDAVNAGPEPDAVNAGPEPDAGPKPNVVNAGPKPNVGPSPIVGPKPDVVNAGLIGKCKKCENKGQCGGIAQGAAMRLRLLACGLSLWSKDGDLVLKSQGAG